MKNLHQKDIFKTAGIYCITNTMNSKKYIGSSKNIYSRVRLHLSQLRRNVHRNIYLQRAFNKYKEEAFYTKVLEIVDCDLKKLREREKHYISTLSPEYNIMKDPVLYITEQETRDRISKTLRRRYRNGEIKAYDHPHRKIAVKVYNYKEELVNEYESIKSLQRELKELSSASIKNNLRKGIYVCKSYIIIPTTLSFDYCIESTLKNTIRPLPVVNIKDNDIILLKGRKLKNVINKCNKRVGEVVTIRDREGVFINVGFIKKLMPSINSVNCWKPLESSELQSN